jgi:hypothetical protein
MARASAQWERFRTYAQSINICLATSYTCGANIFVDLDNGQSFPDQFLRGVYLIGGGRAEMLSRSIPEAIPRIFYTGCLG